jgi:hypothetical protein
LSNKPIISGPAPDKESFENNWLKAADLTTMERDLIIDHFTLKNRKIKGLGSIAKLGTDNQTKFLEGLRAILCRPKERKDDAMKHFGMKKRFMEADKIARYNKIE